MPASAGRRVCAAVLALALAAALAVATALVRLGDRGDGACAAGSLAAPAAAGAVRAARLQQALDDFAARRASAGLQATVLLPDGARWDGAAGDANRERRCAVTIAHLFGVGSVTKLYTAALALRQAEAGAISLDDPVARWIDRPTARRVTVRMLLDHTSGIPSYTGDPWFLARYLALPSKVWRLDELVAAVGGAPTGIEPGSRHVYSNSNYVLLGAILEAASGRPYAALLAEMTGALGLRDTFFVEVPAERTVATGYDESLLRLGTRNVGGARRALLSGAYSAGGVVATSADVALFTREIFAGRVVSAPWLAEMLTFVPAPDPDAPERRGYGLGVRELVIGGDRLVGHTGAIPGYSAITAHDGTRETTVAILSNLSVIDLETLLGSLLAAAER